MKTKTLFKLLISVMLLAALAVGCMISVSADDLVWNLLTDTEAGYRVEDYHKKFTQITEEDGTILVETKDGKYGAHYIYDDKNILGTYRTFSLEGDFYFDAFPSGLRENQYTPEERPLSFLSWIYEKVDASKSRTFNALRIDSKGYIHTLADGTGRTEVKLETGKWYNIRCVFTPMNGISEMFIDDEKVLDFSITRFDPDKYVSYAVRYFDGYYNGDVKMKNLKVKTDSTYTINLLRENAADFIGYQTTKPEGGEFDVRLVFGLDSTEYNRVGYEVVLVTKDEEGNVYSEAISEKSKVVYETLTDANGKTYAVKDLYGYNYAAAITLTDLPLEPIGDYYEVAVRPYVQGMDGMRVYGLAKTLFYTVQADDAGYPVFASEGAGSFTVIASDDTYIYNGNKDDNSKKTELFVRNIGKDANSPMYRAAYYKFTLSPEQVKALDSAATANLKIFVKGVENNSSRIRREMMVYATATDWTEDVLNHSNHAQLAFNQEKLAQLAYEDSAYIVVDIMEYLNEQILNDDGSLTVSFCLVNEGHESALLTYLLSKEADYGQPMIEVGGSLYNIHLNLEKVGNKGYEPWGYAEYLTNQWFDVLRDQIYPKDENGNVLYHEIEDLAPEGYDGTKPTGDFTHEIIWKNGTQWNTNASKGYIVQESEWKAEKYARTLVTLGVSTANKFLDSEYATMISEYDEYGGITNAGFKGEATGFFHTEKLQGRTYIIDPLGNPYFALGINTVCLGDSANHKEYSLAKFGTAENYYNEISASLKDMGITIAYGGDSAELLQVEDGLAIVVGVSVVTPYMSKLGRSQVSEGVYPFNNTINVFDPDYEKNAYDVVQTKIVEKGYANNPRVFGFTTDNEQPSGTDLLDRYLMLDPTTEPTNAFSYATAWTWLARRMDVVAPTLEEYQAHPERAQMNSEFLGFMYGRFYSVARDAIKSVAPNQMYIGSRVNGNCRTDEGYLRVAGYYLDIITTNLYGGLNPDAETIVNFYRYSGKPFIVTEFFAKAMDSIDANGYMIANSTGAGILVKTQQERADYYEHYALAMLESKACVGWTWYRYRDNDQGVYSTGSSSTPLIMLHVTYGANAKANTFMNMETGEILTAQQVGTNYRELYHGEPMASNQNVNKGFYNSNFNSTVVVYTYDKNGKLLESKGYDVQTPENEMLASGTVLKSLDGSKTFTVGSTTNADGTRTETVLTVYDGKYVALATAARSISDHLIGLVRYFDAK
jgi:hypothetical protein